MAHRITTWLIVIWTGFMALGIVAAFLGIGSDCVAMAEREISSCQADAWGRGATGLGLLVLLWFVILVPIAIVWRASRPSVSEVGR
jgi:hypothetical protein